MLAFGDVLSYYGRVARDIVFFLTDQSAMEAIRFQAILEPSSNNRNLPRVGDRSDLLRTRFPHAAPDTYKEAGPPHLKASD